MVTYTTSDGKAVKSSATTAPASALSSGNNIQSWGTTTSVGTYNLGNHVFTTWYVSLDADGSVTGFNAN